MKKLVLFVFISLLIYSTQAWSAKTGICTYGGFVCSATNPCPPTFCINERCVSKCDTKTKCPYPFICIDGMCAIKTKTYTQFGYTGCGDPKTTCINECFY